MTTESLFEQFAEICKPEIIDLRKGDMVNVTDEEFVKANNVSLATVLELLWFFPSNMGQIKKCILYKVKFVQTGQVMLFDENSLKKL